MITCRSDLDLSSPRTHSTYPVTDRRLLRPDLFLIRRDMNLHRTVDEDRYGQFGAYPLLAILKDRIPEPMPGHVLIGPPYRQMRKETRICRSLHP